MQAFAVSKLTKAKCKIANYEQSVFDITISAHNNIKDFLKQVIVYLQMIKTT